MLQKKTFKVLLFWQPWIHTMAYSLFKVINNIGRSRGCPQHVPPKQDPIPSFLHMFSPKSLHVRGQHPPNGSVPPQWEILDPPLNNTNNLLVLWVIVDLYQHQRLLKAHLAVVWTAFNGLKGTIPSHILANLMAVKGGACKINMKCYKIFLILFWNAHKRGVPAQEGALTRGVLLYFCDESSGSNCIVIFTFIQHAAWVIWMIYSKNCTLWANTHHYPLLNISLDKCSVSK